MVSSNTTTTYTFVITIENKGNVSVHATEIQDITSDGFEYVPGSTTSSSSVPPQFVAGEPTTDILKNEILWSFGGVGKELRTSTTWTITFKATANLSRGFYPNVVDMEFAGSPFSSPSQDQFCQFGDESLTISQSTSINCPVGSNGDVSIGQLVELAGGVTSLNGNINIGQTGVVGTITADGNVVALGDDIVIDQQGVINGDVIAAGDVTLNQEITIRGNLMVGGTLTVAQQVTVEGFLWSAGDVTISQEVTIQGDVISGGDIDVEQQVTLGGSVYASGSVTVDQQSNISGTIYENLTSIPSTPPIDLSSTGSTAVVTAVDIYNITTTDGDTTTTCTVFVLEDPITGTFGAVEDCTTQ